jgi:hypothetical protein
MNESPSDRETAVAQMRRVRDQLNCEIESVDVVELLDRIRGHRYSDPFLQRLAMKAVSKRSAPELSNAGE